MNIDKINKKLKEFDTLNKKKKKKVIDAILVDDEFREWLYQISDKSGPKLTTIGKKIFNNMSKPEVVQYLVSYMENTDNLDHTSYCILYMSIENGVEMVNKYAAEVSKRYKDGGIDRKKYEDIAKKNEKYSKNLQDLLYICKSRCKKDMKEIEARTVIPMGIIRATYFITPNRKYIKPDMIDKYTENLLNEIYTYVSEKGINGEVRNFKWGSFFGRIFGGQNMNRIIVALMSEGDSKIDRYRASEFFNDVKTIWNSITNFILFNLEKMPYKEREELLRTYFNKVDPSDGSRRFKVLSIPNRFENTQKALLPYIEKISYMLDNGSDKEEVVEKEEKKVRVEEDDRVEYVSTYVEESEEEDE